jgi:AcrR family transcriptional regulator
VSPHEPSGRRPNHHSSAAETREQLIAAAVEEFLERGYDQIRVQDITSRAGFTTGALYAHFDSRTSILNEAIRLHATDLIIDLTKETQQATERTSVARSLAVLMSEPPRPMDRVLTEGLALAARDETVRAALLPSLIALADRITSGLSVDNELHIGNSPNGEASNSETPDSETPDGAEHSPHDLRTVFAALTIGAVVMRAIDLRQPDPEGGHGAVSDSGGLEQCLDSIWVALGGSA